MFFVDVNKASASLEPQVHGFISQGYLKTSGNNYLIDDSENGTFQFFEAGINFGLDLSDRLSLGFQLLARDFGDYGNGDVVVDWANANYEWKEWLGLRVGRIKIPYGLYNETRDVDMLRTTLFLPAPIYNENFRDSFSQMQGIGFYGAIDASSSGIFEYQLNVGQGSIDRESDAQRIIEEVLRMVNYPGQVNGSYEVDPSFAGKLVWNTPLTGLLLSGSFIMVDACLPLTNGETVFNNSDWYVFSLEYTLGDCVVASEYLIMDWELGLGAIRFPSTFESYYVGLSYRFTHWLETAVFYSELSSNEDGNNRDLFVDVLGSPDHHSWQKDFGLSFRFDVNNHWLIKLEGHLIDGNALVSIIDNNNNPQALEKYWHMIGVKMTFHF